MNNDIKHSEEIKIKDLCLNPLMFTITCNREDETAIVNKFNSVGFGVPCRGPGNITFRYDESVFSKMWSYFKN
jgi:hypothetical protein